MIKVNVLYANGEGARFDHDYYREQPVPLVRRVSGLHSIDKGLAGLTPGTSAP